MPDSISATARRLLDLPDPPERSATSAAARRALDRVGGGVGFVIAAAPTIAFVAGDAVAGLLGGIIALIATSACAFAVRLRRREPLGVAVAGLLVALVCGSVAAIAGEARAFFLPTMVVPAIFVLAYLVSFIARRPLMALLINPMSGGPREWRRHRGMRAVYYVSSFVGLTMAFANLVARIGFYVADQTGALAAVQVISTSLFAVHFAVTLVVARRTAARVHTGRPA